MSSMSCRVPPKWAAYEQASKGNDEENELCRNDRCALMENERLRRQVPAMKEMQTKSDVSSSVAACLIEDVVRFFELLARFLIYIDHLTSPAIREHFEDLLPDTQSVPMVLLVRCQGMINRFDDKVGAESRGMDFELAGLSEMIYTGLIDDEKRRLVRQSNRYTI